MVLAFTTADAVTGYGNTTILEAVNRSAQGIGPLTGLATTQRGAGANMSVDVATGTWYISGTVYGAAATTNVVISAADATNPRYDVVYADSSGISVTTGTAAATPKVPNLSANRIPLAVVAVAAGATTISTSACTDVRVPIIQRPLRVYQASGSFTNTAAGDLATFTVPAGLCSSTAEKFKVVANVYASVGLLDTYVRIDTTNSGIVANTAAQTAGTIEYTVMQDQGTNTAAINSGIGTTSGADRLTALTANFITAGFALKLRGGVNAAGTGYYSYSVYLE